MKDILGRELKVGDIVAHGTRSGNSGDLNVKIIAEMRTTKSRWSNHDVEELKVVNYYLKTQEWDKKKEEWVDVEAHYTKGGTGWSNGDNMLIVNDSVTADIKDFLRSLI